MSRIVAIVMLVALITRVPYFLNIAVPLNDGGMFAQIVDELRSNGFRLGTHTKYNLLNIPLSYPPLGFYFAAIAGKLLGMPTVEVMKGLPLLFNLASIAAFVFLADRILRNRAAVLCSGIFIATVPQAGNWLLMGGGLTRSPGFFFSVMAMIAAYDALHGNRRKDVVLTGVYAALAGLCHLESGTVVGLVLPLFGLYYGPIRKSIPRLFVSAGVAILLALPWVIWLKMNVGFDPLHNASQTGGATTASHAMKETLRGQILVDRFAWLSVLTVPGMIWLFYRRNWLLPVWIFAIVFLVSRSAYTQVSVPLAMLLGQTWMDLSEWIGNRTIKQKFRTPYVIASWALLLGILASWAALERHRTGNRLPGMKWDLLSALTPADRHAMEWVRYNTPPDAHFLVISERMDEWYTDMVGEWFPYFAKRRSIFTVQGREWRPNREFATWQVYLTAVASVPQLAQADAVVKASGQHYEYIFVSGPFWRPHNNLARQIAQDYDMEQVHAEGNVRIFRRLRPAE